MGGRLLGLAILLALASCKSAKADRRKLDRAAAPAPTAAPGPSASAALPRAVAPRPAGPPVALASDLCHVARGPVQVAYTGQATLWLGEGDVEPRILFDVDGIPRAVTLPDAPKPKGKAGEAKKAERLALSEPAERAPLPGCAAAGGALFCMDKAGAVRRATRPGEEGKVVAQARPGTPIAAAPIAGSRVVLAWLGDRRTTEGTISVALAALDDGPPVTISEDGAGATFVALAPRGEEVVAMYIDARRVLTPVHARVLTAGGKLGLGPDAVLFVGAGGDARPSGAIAQAAPGSELALLAGEKDDKAFGLAAIKIDEQPRDDARVTWSLYPAAMDHAVVAATQGRAPALALRSRPASDAKGSAEQALELGELGADGAWKALCPVAQGARFADLAVAVDRAGAVWVAYTDGEGTWVEKRGR